MNCPTAIDDGANIWVIPPGPSWWQLRIDSVSLSRMTMSALYWGYARRKQPTHPVLYRGVFMPQALQGFASGCVTLRWLIYSAALELAQHRVSLSLISPPRDAQPPFNFEGRYVEEAEQWLHTSLRLSPTIPPAIALCPSLLKLMRMKLDLYPADRMYTNPLAPQRAWHCHSGPVTINVYEIVKHQGKPRSSTASYDLLKRCIGPPNAFSALCVDALSGDVNLWRWIDADRWPNPRTLTTSTRTLKTSTLSMSSLPPSTSMNGAQKSTTPPGSTSTTTTRAR